MLPKISIVTASFNSIHTITETIESVRNQDYPNWEHWVIDGGSTDGTLDVIKKYPHLKWVSEKDEGHYHAMNKGIERSTGEIINILNADDCLVPGALRKVGEAFEAHPEWDALFGDIIYVDGQNQEIYRRREVKYDYDVLRLSGVCYVIHPTLFVKKSVYGRLGLYLHKQYLNCCDYEFILRMGKEKCRIGHIRDFLVYYRYHEHGQSADRRITQNMAKESLRIRRAYGMPAGFAGKILGTCARAKRQVQKLIYSGRCDLIPAAWILKKHMRAKTNFSSNIGLDKL